MAGDKVSLKWEATQRGPSHRDLGGERRGLAPAIPRVHSHCQGHGQLMIPQAEATQGPGTKGG